MLQVQKRTMPAGSSSRSRNPFVLSWGRGPKGQSIPLGVISTTPHVCLLTLAASILLNMSCMHGG